MVKRKPSTKRDTSPSKVDLELSLFAGQSYSRIACLDDEFLVDTKPRHAPSHDPPSLYYRISSSPLHPLPVVFVSVFSRFVSGFLSFKSIFYHHIISP